RHHVPRLRPAALSAAPSPGWEVFLEVNGYWQKLAGALAECGTSGIESPLKASDPGPSAPRAGPTGLIRPAPRTASSPRAATGASCAPRGRPLSPERPGGSAGSPTRPACGASPAGRTG